MSSAGSNGSHVVLLSLIAGVVYAVVVMSYQQHGVCDEVTIEAQGGEVGEAPSEGRHGCSAHCCTRQHQRPQLLPIPSNILTQMRRGCRVGSNNRNDRNDCNGSNGCSDCFLLKLGGGGGGGRDWSGTCLQPLTTACSPTSPTASQAWRSSEVREGQPWARPCRTPSSTCFDPRRLSRVR